MKKQLLIDMDGVLADVYPKLIREQSKILDREITIESLIGMPEREAFPHIEEILTTNHFFRELPLMEGCYEGLRYLNDKYEVLIVSSATEFPNCLNDKLKWLYEHFPFIRWQQVILCGSKASIRGDIMIDDHPKNLDFFPGKRFIFDQPHNSGLIDPSYTRVRSWKDIYLYL